MKYIVMTCTIGLHGEYIGDVYSDEYDDFSAARSAAEADWAHTSEGEKRSGRKVFVLESADPDEDSPNHFDGNIVFSANDASAMSKTYYFPNSDHAESFFGSADPICVDLNEVERLAREWGYDSTEALLDEMHEASAVEIAEFGTYDS